MEGARRSLSMSGAANFSASSSASSSAPGAGGENALDLYLGGVLQVDYRYYQENSRADNGFDIRQARLSVSGLLNSFLYYRLEYELQGNDAQNLTEAYGEWEIDPQQILRLGAKAALRIGQFKEPYGLEWQTRDSALFFAERSMGYYLTPQRDVGLMFSGSLFHEIIHYAAGLFNGDGRDGSTRGSRNDQSEAGCPPGIRSF